MTRSSEWRYVWASTAPEGSALAAALCLIGAVWPVTRQVNDPETIAAKLLAKIKYSHKLNGRV